MLSYVLLSEADQKRFGCTERLSYVLTDVTARELATLQKAFGYHTLDDVASAIRGMAVFDDEGKLTDIRKDSDLFLALTWVGLRQNGLLSAHRPDEMAAELADLDIQIAWAQLDWEDVEGKDESSTQTGTSPD